ncbi:MAG: glycosyltransferase [Candidatus Dormiibacterota bacterium]
MRVLFSSTWGLGHIYPLVPLARAFAAAGHDVLWATSADSCERIVAAGLDARPAGLAGARLREVVEEQHAAAAAHASPGGQSAFIFPRMFGGAFAPPMLADLLPLARSWQPDLLVHESGELAAPLVGAILGVPSVTHGYGGAIPASFLAAAGERVAPLWAQHGQPLPPYAGCFTSLYLDVCPAAVQTVSTSHIPHIQAMRPEQDTGQPPASLPAYLADDERPLVYLTFGTLFNHSPVLRAAARALAALPVRLLVTVGPSGDPAALGTALPNVWIERWVHQPQVLQHGHVVASHAGSGTFLGALAGGIPQLCLPQAADQFRNAKAGVRSGAALALQPEQADSATIVQAVETLLADDRYRANARRVAAEIRAMPSPADVVALLAGVSQSPTVSHSVRGDANGPELGTASGCPSPACCW